MKTRLAVITTSFFLAFSALSATATPLTIEFTGWVSSVPSGVASAFTVGDSASGFYTIDSNTPDLNSDPTIGLYIGPTNFSFQFGSYLATAGGGSGGDSAGVFNDSASGDRFQTNAVNPSGDDVNGYFLTNLTLRLIDDNGTVFSGDALPASLDIADFDIAEAQMIFQHETLSSANVFADISSISIVSNVPEPTSLALMGLGLVGLGFAHRKKTA